MKKYGDIVLFLLIIIAAFLYINNSDNITSYAIGDNGTIIDTNLTVVYLSIFYPADYYNSTQKNVNFLLNLKNIEVLYYKVNEGSWGIGLVNSESVGITLSLNSGLNTVYFYGCKGNWCSLMRNVKVYYTGQGGDDVVEDNTNVSIITNTTSGNNLTQNISENQLNNNQDAGTTVIDKPKKKIDIFIIIPAILIILLIIYLISIRKKKDKDDEARIMEIFKG